MRAAADAARVEEIWFAAVEAPEIVGAVPAEVREDLRAFDEEGAGQGIAAGGHLFVAFVLAAGIESAGGNHVAGLDLLEDRVGV